MSDNGQWQWQERGKAWKGVGIYHVTLVVPSREPLLGTLVIPENDAKKAYISESTLGQEVVACLLHLHDYYPEIRVVRFCLMPDHLHAVIHVRWQMPRGIKSVVRGFWQAVMKRGREYSAMHLLFAPNTIRDKEQTPSHDKEQTPSHLESPETLPYPIFTQMPYIRPLVRQGQLAAMMQYVKMNPQRLATKRLKPGYFRVQEEIEIAGRKYAGVGIIKLLLAEQFKPVHVRSSWVEDAEQHGYNQPLRDYMNGCVLAARQGAVMVSPFISKQEKMVQEVLLREKLPFILIADNGFRDYYKPADAWFDAVAEGRVLILSPWEYDAGKRHVTRAECVAMNAMAEEICEVSN